MKEMIVPQTNRELRMALPKGWPIGMLKVLRYIEALEKLVEIGPKKEENKQ
jgi:hypothetical protein